MAVPRQTRRQIERLKALLPSAPSADGLAFRAGRVHEEIAQLYRDAGEYGEAADWLVQGATFAFSCRDFVGALQLVKAALELEPGRPDAVALQVTAWKLIDLKNRPSQF